MPVENIIAGIGALFGRFLVFHPSWGSLAAAYGLVQWPIERDGKAPGALELARLIRDARAAGVHELLVQPQFDDAPARVVADAIGARLVVLDPLAYDWSANLRSAGRAIAEATVP